MKNSIIIIESPNKIKKIESITGAKVFATAGHFLELKDIDISKGFAPVFDYVESKKKNMMFCIKECKDKKVYIATDPDREGYGIGYMFYHKIKNLAKEVYRAEFHEITESGIKKGLEQSVLFAQTNKKYYEAFLGRRVSDMFIGYSLSPYISRQLSIKALSAGRVQTPALGLIVKREEEIKNFHSLPIEKKMHYSLCAKIFLLGKEATLKHIKEGKEYKFEDKQEAFKELDKLKETQSAVLVSIDKKESKEAPPKPFTTSKLLKAGSKTLNISTKEVQSIAQKLFEAGLITYIRTDCEFISEEYLKQHQKFYQPLYKDIYEYTLYSSGKNSQAEAHEAIRITHPHSYEELSSVCEKEDIKGVNEKRLYELIFKNTICSQSKPAIYENTTLIFNIRLTSFVLRFKNLKFGGYLDAFKEDVKEEKESDDEKETKIERIDTSRLQLNDLFDIHEIFIKDIAKTAPKRYVESDFIEVLEKNKIGRPSTYSTYLPTLQNKEYISIEEKKREITPTPRGIAIVNFFKNNIHNWILDIDFTKSMEEKLDDITSNKACYLEFMQELENKLGNEVGKFGSSVNKDKKEKKIIPPSAKQIEFAKAIATKLKLIFPENLEKDCYVTKDFIEKNIEAFNKVKKQEYEKK